MRTCRSHPYENISRVGVGAKDPVSGPGGLGSKLTQNQDWHHIPRPS